MFNFMRVLLAFLALISISAFANDGSYFIYGGVSNPPKFPDPQSACDAYFDLSPPSWASKSPFLKRDNESYWRCQILSNDNGQHSQYGFVEKRSCPADTVFNTKLAECAPPEPPEECENGKISGPYVFTGVMAGSYVVMNPVPPPTACKNSCKYFRQYNSKCNNGTMGGKPFCLVSYVSDGSSCKSTDSPDPEDPDKLPPLPDDGDDDGNTGNNGDGDGNDGNSNGDGYGDAPEQLPPSDAEGDAKESTLKDIYNELSRLAKEDTSKKTADNTKKISDLIASTNGKLDGVIKAINDKPVGGGGSGSGNGNGDGESVVGGDFCDVPPVCTGDAIQCAILDQQYITRCNAEDLYDYEKHKDKIDDLFNDPKFELKDPTEVEMSSFVTGHTRWLSGTCPADETMSLRTNGGRTFSLSYLPLCNAADAIAPLIVIIATLLATLYVGRGAGG